MSDEAGLNLLLFLFACATFADCGFDSWSKHRQCMALIERGQVPHGCPVWLEAK